jgi:hypothetical protein
MRPSVAWRAGLDLYPWMLRTLADDAEGSFIVVRDGTSPLAFADPHGAWLRWMAPAQGSG